MRSSRSSRSAPDMVVMEVDTDIKVVGSKSSQFRIAWLRFAATTYRLRYAIVAICVGIGITVGYVLSNGGGVQQSSFHQVSLPNSVTFIAIGDWGRRNVDGQETVTAQLGPWTARSKASFIVSVGDNFYTDGVQGPDDPLFDESFRHVYTHSSLQVPWYLILGNHDYRGNIQAQVNWPGDKRWNMPAPNHTQKWALPPVVPQVKGGSGSSTNGIAAAAAGNDTARDCIYAVFSDTSPLMSSYRKPEKLAKYPQMGINFASQPSPAQQIVWTQEQLAKGAAECKALLWFAHHPIYSAGEHGDQEDLISSFLPLAKEYRVDAYIAGHDHTLVHLRDGGAGGSADTEGKNESSTDYIVTGGGSEFRLTSATTPQTMYLKDTNGFTVHSVNATHVRHTFVAGYDGAILYQFTRPLKDKGTGGGAQK